MHISYADYILHPQLEAMQPEAGFNNFVIAARSLSENKLDKIQLLNILQLSILLHQKCCVLSVVRAGCEIKPLRRAAHQDNLLMARQGLDFIFQSKQVYQVFAGLTLGTESLTSETVVKIVLISCLQRFPSLDEKKMYFEPTFVEFLQSSAP